MMDYIKSTRPELLDILPQTVAEEMDLTPRERSLVQAVTEMNALLSDATDRADEAETRAGATEQDLTKVQEQMSEMLALINSTTADTIHRGLKQMLDSITVGV